MPRFVSISYKLFIIERIQLISALKTERISMTITYLCPTITSPTGGVKVIYKHSQLLNENGVSSDVRLYPNENQAANWFEHTATIRNEANFNIKKDFIIIPEAVALYYGLECIEMGLKFAIFVQNGFKLNEDVEKSDFEKLDFVYKKANYIISISRYTSEIIKIKYPNLAYKVLNVLPGVSVDYPIKEKQKLITYMPRKLKSDSDYLIYLLKSSISNDWTIKEIDNLNEGQVKERLSESSIFLSFLEKEGFGLPALEASLAGNIVVGYTGQGAREFFARPIFREIQQGDMVSFLSEISIAIKQIESDENFIYSLFDQRRILMDKYSYKAILPNLITMGNILISA